MRGKFIALVLLQALLLAGIAGYKGYWSARGPTVVLRTVPVDPRDLFRGDYVALRYEISDIDLSRVRAAARIDRNDTVYVGLEPDPDGASRCVSVDAVRPPGRLSIRGRVTLRAGSRIAVTYGIESYFVAEGRGRAVETARNSRDLKVEVALGPDGQGIVKTLRMDGAVVR